MVNLCLHFAFGRLELWGSVLEFGVRLESQGTMGCSVLPPVVHEGIRLLTFRSGNYIERPEGFIEEVQECRLGVWGGLGGSVAHD